jgi:uncharacterized membrane protein YqaE (UPF0057 family)
MNSEQWTSLIRTVLALLIGPAGYFVTKGILTPDQADQLMPAILSVLTVVIGAVIAKWGISSHSASSVVAAVNSDSVPGVKAVATTSPSPAVSVDSSTGAVKVAEPSAKGV